MNTLHKGFIASLLLVLVAILLIGGGMYVYMQQKLLSQPMAESSITLSAITTPSEIREIIASSTASYYGTSIADLKESLELILVGKRYVVFHVQSLKEEGGVRLLNIFDLQTNEVVNHIAATPVLQTPEILIYANTNIELDPVVSYLCAYRLDTSTCEVMPETVIKSNQEEYWDPMGNPVEVTAHTDTSFTITVWSGYEKRAREVTYQIP